MMHDAKVRGAGQLPQPFRPRVANRDRAGEGKQHGHERLHDVPGPKNRDGPRRIAGRMRLEIEFHRAAAGHAHIALEAPVHEARLCRVRAFRCQQSLGKRDRLRLDTTAAHGPGMPARGGDDHFGPGILRGAAERFDEHDQCEGCAVALECGDRCKKITHAVLRVRSCQRSRPAKNASDSSGGTGSSRLNSNLELKSCAGSPGASPKGGPSAFSPNK